MQNNSSSNSSNRPTRSLTLIDPEVRTQIEEANFLVMRRKSDNMPLNISFTESGLRWTANNRRRLLFFRNAELRNVKLTLDTNESIWYPKFHALSPDGLEKSPDVVIERFSPMDHLYPDGQIKSRNQVAEYRWVDKALRFIYMQNDENRNRWSEASSKSDSGEVVMEEAFQRLNQEHGNMAQTISS